MFLCDASVLIFKTPQNTTRCDFLFYMHVPVCCGWCAYMQVCMSILVSRGYFSVSSSCGDVTIFWLSQWWQLVGMHIVIKQFPVCKCPVYTFLLQSLSLDRLLEYEESSYTMKNENSKTSIKKSIVPTLNSRHAWNWCQGEDPEIHTTTHTHKQKRSRPTIHNGSITASW